MTYHYKVKSLKISKHQWILFLKFKLLFCDININDNCNKAKRLILNGEFSIHSISSAIGWTNFGRSNNFGELLLLPLLLNSPALQPCLPLISWDLYGSRRFVTKDECPSGHQTWTPLAGSSETFVCSRVGRCAWKRKQNIDRYTFVIFMFFKLFKSWTYHWHITVCQAVG